MSVIDLEKRAASDGELSSQQPSDILEVNSETSSPGGEVVMEERSIHGIKWTLAVMAILTVDFLFALDNTIVSCHRPPSSKGSFLECLADPRVFSLQTCNQT